MKFFLPAFSKAFALFVATVVFNLSPSMVFGQGTTTYNASGTFLAPAGVTLVDADLFGAGGGGGWTNDNRGANGGGGGAFTRQINNSVNPLAAPYPVTVGVGGTGQRNGVPSTDGGKSVFLGNEAEGGNRAVARTVQGIGGSVGCDCNTINHKGGDGGIQPSASNGRPGAGGGASGNFMSDGANGEDGLDLSGVPGGMGGIGEFGGGSGGGGGTSEPVPSGDERRGEDGFQPGGGGGGRARTEIMVVEVEMEG
jgi:hypothetical protein